MLDISDAIFSSPTPSASTQFDWQDNALSCTLPANLSLDAALLPLGPPESAPCDEGQWRISIALNPATARYQLEMWWDNVSSRPYDLLFEVTLVWGDEVAAAVDSSTTTTAARGAGAATPSALRLVCGPSRIESTFGWAKYDLFSEKVVARQLKTGASPMFRLRVACPSLAV